MVPASTQKVLTGVAAYAGPGGDTRLVTRAMLHGGMQVDIRRDERALRLIRMRDTRFFQTVRDKLTEWTR